MSCSVLATLFAVAATCAGLENVRCGDSKHVLKSEPMIVYGDVGSQIPLFPIKINGTDLNWRVERNYHRFVKRIYRRLVVTDVAQFAGASAWYELTRNGAIVYTSAKAEVRIGSPAVLIMNNPSKVIVAYRSKNYTICFKSFGFPRPVVSLYGVISNIPRLVTMNATFRFSNSCLEFRSARLEDGGEYMLQAKNCFGSSVKKFRLKIFEKPRLSIDFRSVNGSLKLLSKGLVVSMEVSGHMILPYTLTGVPSPTIEWFHSNLRVDGSTYNSSHLILHNVELSDAGRYLIVAKNTVGEARASFWLSVRDSTDSWNDTITIVAGGASTTIRQKPVSPTNVSASVKPAHSGIDFSQSPNDLIRNSTLPAEESPSATGIAVQSVPINGREMEHHGCGMAGSDQDSSCAGNTSDFPSSWILITAVTGGVVVVGVIVVVIICCRKGICCQGSDKDSDKRGSLQSGLKSDSSLK
jgi:hypothetical protein